MKDWTILLPYLKAIHIVGFVVWFAGLFYLVRLLVYHVEAEKKSDQEKLILQKQYTQMQKRLYKIIVFPGMLITVICGFVMVFINPYYMEPWLSVKLILIFCLVLYNNRTGRIMRNLHSGGNKLSSFQLRVWNEVATLLLISIIFLAVLRDTLDFTYGMIGIILVAMLLYFGIRLYKKHRKGNQ